MSLFDLIGDGIGALTAATNSGNSSAAANNASNIVRGESVDAQSALNSGRDAALAYLNPTQSLGINAGQALGNAYGLYGAAPAGSQAGLTRADPYNIGAPTAPTQAGFNFDPSTVNVNQNPGLAYAYNQALGSVGQNSYATGKGLSGAASIALTNVAQNQAYQNYNTAYNQQYGAASDAYNRNTTYNNQNYSDQYGAATDAYARQNAQFQSYLSGVSGLNTAGNTAAAQAASVQTGTANQVAAGDLSTGGNLANIATGKALAQNTANTAIGGDISSGLNSLGSSSYGNATNNQSLLSYLGLGG